MNVKRRKNKIRKILALLTFSALVLLVTSYAWFVGMSIVKISEFDVEIATTEGLFLSLDGKNWDRSVSISRESLNTVSYEGHTNSWGGEGLVPISTIGEIDTTSSRMVLFEKSSITASAGGYRLMASLIDNTGEEEKDGYVAFDLFIKNISGSQYLENYDELDEEAIYLLRDESQVTVGLAGVEDTGIENSVRVAFAQIGRVSSDETDHEKIASITCNADEEGKASVVDHITGICRPASIWEPNDIAHVENAILWYNKACRHRIGESLILPESFSGSCNEVIDGEYYDTYVVSKEISSSDKVDVYDGEDYNGYTKVGTPLVAYKYYTDSMKNETGTARKAFMTLAPNSITKVRVYIYIEGQDIDNYDYASIGKQVAVKFGFTKQRFIESDLPYDGPTNPVLTDTIKPVITLIGSPTINITKGTAYIDEGATALDNVDGDLTNEIKVINPVDVNNAGKYIIAYDVIDKAGNVAVRVTRTVTVTE